MCGVHSLHSNATLTCSREWWVICDVFLSAPVVLQNSLLIFVTVKLFQVVFSPLFVMKSHLPDPVILHIEKRSLGLRESQLIHGQGHQEPLLNAEADITHHLTFQAR